MPTLDGTIFLPDREAADHPWHAMVITSIGHYPNRTEVVLAPTDEDMSRERLGDIFEQASAYAAETLAN
jgi:hypothetical protein